MKLSLVPSLRERSAKLNAFAKELADVQSRGHNTGLLIGDVVLEASTGVNSQLNSLVDRTTKSSIILCGIEVVRIVLGIVCETQLDLNFKDISVHIPM